MFDNLDQTTLFFLGFAGVVLSFLLLYYIIRMAVRDGTKEILEELKKRDK